MTAETRKMRERLARALVGNLLQNPIGTLRAIPSSFSLDVLPGAERQLFFEGKTIAESNGQMPDTQIDPGKLIARISNFDTNLFTECIELSSTSAAAALQASKLIEIHQTEELRRAANAFLKAESREELDQTILQFYKLAEKNIEGSSVTIRTLAEYLKDPDASKPPRAIVSRLAWHARTVLLAAREKEGKSTLASGAAAAVSRGAEFLGEPTEEARVLYFALEDHPADLIRRLKAFGAKPENVFILERVENPLPDILAAVAQVKPALTIIDTLPALVESLNLDPTSSADWTPVMLGLTRLARDSGTAVLILHHAAKSGTGYRDSSAIGASVDMILILEESKSNESTRKITPRGRWHLDHYTVRLEGTPETSMSYMLGTGAVSVDAQVLSYVEQNPGCNVRDLREGVGGNAQQVDEARKRLLKKGMIVNHRQGRAHSYHTPENRPCLALGHVPDGDCASVSPHRNAVGHDAGHIDECNVSNVGRPMGGHGHDVTTDTTVPEDANDLPF